MEYLDNVGEVVKWLLACRKVKDSGVSKEWSATSVRVVVGT